MSQYPEISAWELVIEGGVAMMCDELFRSRSAVRHYIDRDPVQALIRFCRTLIASK